MCGESVENIFGSEGRYVALFYLLYPAPFPNSLPLTFPFAPIHLHLNAKDAFLALEVA